MLEVYAYPVCSLTAPTLFFFIEYFKHDCICFHSEKRIQSIMLSIFDEED